MKLFLFSVCMSLFVCLAFAQIPQIDTNFYSLTSGQVFSTTVNNDDNITYIGGTFESVGVSKSNAMIFDEVTGQPDLNFLSPNNTVSSVIADDSGGWFIAGNFTKLGTLNRNRIAHIDPNGVPTSLTIDVNGNVRALHLKGDTLFISGSFSMVNGQSAQYLAGVNITNGNVITFPSLDLSAVILTFSTDNNSLYIGGQFSEVGGIPRMNLAKFDLLTMSLSPWNPTTNAAVFSILLDDDVLYCGGGFTEINGVSRLRIAGIDKNTGVLTSLSATINNTVTDIELHNNQIYFVGTFTNVNGMSRNRAASCNLVTNTLTNWNPNLSQNGTKVYYDNNFIYVSGSFNSVNGLPRDYVARTDTELGIPSSWNPSIGSPNVASLNVSNGKVLCVGGFQTIQHQPRSKLAALNTQTGDLLPIDFGEINGVVRSIDYHNGVLYVGGEFTAIDGNPRNRIAAFNASTGDLLSWNPNCNGTVYSIHAGDLRVYVGGEFTNIGGGNRNNLAVIRVSDGTSIPSWNPNVNGIVTSISVGASAVYFGGQFTSVSGTSRSNLAAVNMAFGNLITTFNPVMNDFVFATELLDNNLLAVGGAFNEFDNLSTGPLVILDLSSNAVVYSKNDLTGVVYRLRHMNNRLYVGGGFEFFQSLIGNSINFFELDLDLLTPTTWRPNPNSVVYDMGFWQNSISIAGTFFRIDQMNYRGFAVFNDLCTPSDLPIISANVNNICPSSSVDLTIVSGLLNNAGNWVWRENDCNGNIVGTGTSISINPIDTTTYFVRGEGGCVQNLPCAAITIIVEDTVFPTLIPPSDLIIVLPIGECSMENILLGTPIASDNCEVVSIVNNAPTSFGVGVTEIVWSAFDQMGNMATGIQNVEVIDNEPPVLVPPSNIVSNTDSGLCSNSSLSLGNAVAMDNCGILSVTNDAPNEFPVGVTLVNWVATDVNGNSSFAIQTVTINDDELPSIVAPNNVSISNNSGECFSSNVVLGSPLVSDNCGILTISNDAPSNFQVGSTLVTWTVEDINNNINVATQLVEVLDNEFPIFINLNDTTIAMEVGECYALASLIQLPTVSDNCGIQSLINDASTTLSEGIHQITWTLTDIHGNQTTAIQAVTVLDNQLPFITPPANIQVVAPIGECSESIANLGTPIASDNCGILQVTNNAPNEFPVGITEVVWTVTDVNGNESSEIQLIEVLDQEAPVFNPVFDLEMFVSVSSCYFQTSDLPIPVATDNCGSIIISNNLPDSLTVGDYEIIWEAIDLSGNSSTITQALEIFDSIAPVILNCPSQITSCSQIVHWDTVMALDNCSNEMIYTSNYFSGDSFSIGVTEVIIELSDQYGNTESCIFNVEVLDAIDSLDFDVIIDPIVFGNDGVITVIASNSGVNYTFEWSGPGNFSSTQQSLMNLEFDGVYVLLVTNEDGCTLEIQVLLESYLAVGSVDNKYSIYPNPTSTDIHIVGPNKLYYKLLDANGRLILEGDSKVIHVRPLSSGLYFLWIQDVFGNQVMHKVSVLD